MYTAGVPQKGRGGGCILQVYLRREGVGVYTAGVPQKGRDGGVYCRCPSEGLCCI